MTDTWRVTEILTEISMLTMSMSDNVDEALGRCWRKLEVLKNRPSKESQRELWEEFQRLEREVKFAEVTKTRPLPVKALDERAKRRLARLAAS